MLTSVESNLTKGHITVWSCQARRIKWFLDPPPSYTLFLGPRLITPQMGSQSVQPFLYRSPVCQTHVHTTLRATSAAIGRITPTACRRCGIKSLQELFVNKPIWLSMLSDSQNKNMLPIIRPHRRHGLLLQMSYVDFPVVIFSLPEMVNTVEYSVVCELCKNGWTDCESVSGLSRVGTRNHVLGGGVKIGRIHSPPPGVTRRRCGLLPNNLRHLLLFRCCFYSKMLINIL